MLVSQLQSLEQKAFRRIFVPLTSDIGTSAQPGTSEPRKALKAFLDSAVPACALLPVLLIQISHINMEMEQLHLCISMGQAFLDSVT